MNIPKEVANDYKTCSRCKKQGSMVCMGNFCRVCGHSNTAALVAAQVAALAALAAAALWLRSAGYHSAAFWAWALVAVLAVGDVCLLGKLWLEHRKFKRKEDANE